MEEEESSSLVECDILDLILNGGVRCTDLNDNQSTRRRQNQHDNSESCFLDALLSGTQVISNSGAGRRNIQKNNSKRKNCTLLLGPKQSGKTSIAMDVAHSILCRHMSLVKGYKSSTKGERENDIRCETESSSSMVVLIRHALQKIESRSQEVDVSSGDIASNAEKNVVESIPWFPMKFNSSVPEKHNGYKSSYVETYSESEERSEPVENDLNGEWNEEALKHIAIHYPANYRELIQLLASLQGMLVNNNHNNNCDATDREGGPEAGQTIRDSSSPPSCILKGIIVDDLHLFLSSSTSQENTTLAASSTTNVTSGGERSRNTSPCHLDDPQIFIKFHQIVSLSLDAANCIEGMQCQDRNRRISSTNQSPNTTNSQLSNETSVEHIMWVMNNDEIIVKKHPQQQSMVLSTGVSSIVSVSPRYYYEPHLSSSNDSGRNKYTTSDSSATATYFDVVVTDSACVRQPNNTTQRRRGTYEVQRLPPRSPAAALHRAEWTIY